VLPVRVYFEDTDFSGAAYHASYLRWCERGRSDYLRLLGIAHRALAEGTVTGVPCAFAVRRIEAEFLRPVHIDEILEVNTAAGEITKASITLHQSITRDDRTIFLLKAQCVLVSLSGKLLRFPAHLFEQMPKAEPSHE
jgi:acyl-CoA thioester hydrolase